jgi:hypothetical protein
MPVRYSSVRLLPPCSRAGRARRLPLRVHALQEPAGGLLMRVLRHKLAPECLGENGLVEMIDQLAGAGRVGRQTINPVEGFFDALNSSLLLGGRWQWRRQFAEVT